MAKAVLRSGKDLLLEKPTTTTALQARKLLQLAEEKKLVAMMSHEFRWMPERRTFTDLVQNRIGELRELHLNSFMNFASSMESPPHGWLWDSRYDGGILGALGSHLIDQVRTSTAMEVADVSARLFTRTPRRKTREGVYARVTADDGFVADLTFENGASALLNVTTTTRTAPKSRIVAAGERGLAMLEGNQVFLADEGGELSPVDIPEHYSLEEIGGDRRIPPFLKLVEQLSKSLQDRISYSPSLLDGWRNQQVIDAIRQSHATGSRIRIT